MAMNEVTYIGYTVAGVDAKVDGPSSLASARIIGDNKNQGAVDSTLIDKDENNKDLTDRNSDQLAAMATEISASTVSRYAKCGNVLVEPTPEGSSLTTKINIEADYFASTSASIKGMETAAQLNVKLTEIDDKQILNSPKIDSLLVNSVESNDSFKELYNTVMDIDLTDTSSPAGFEYTMKKKIQNLADQGDQKRGNCLIYKDENSKSFYELYIQNGLIALEEVPNPDKDVILSYLNNSYYDQEDNEHRYQSTKILKLNDNSAVVVNFYNFRMNIRVLTFDPTKTIISESHLDVAVAGLGDHFDSFSFNFKLLFNSVNNMLTIILSPYTFIYDDYHKAKLIIRNFTIDNNSIVEQLDPLLDYVSLSERTIFRYGHYVSNNYIVGSSLTKYINIYNKISGVLYATINLGLDRFMEESTNDTHLYCDDEHVYVLCKYETGSNLEIYIKKFNINDQSLVSTYNIAQPSNHFRYSSLVSINDNVLAFYHPSFNQIIFIDKNTMTEYTDTNVNFGPITLSGTNNAIVYIQDLGNSKILVKNKYDTIIIYTYDGYEIFTHYTTNTFVSAINEKIIIECNSVNHPITTVKTKPIYKYK